MTSPELIELINDNPRVRLLDVRTPGEFESAHIEGAYNLPLDQLGEHQRELARVNDPVVLICQSGGRARQAEQLLTQAGLGQLRLLEGGMNAWTAAGNAVHRGGRPRLSIERQVRIIAGLLVTLFSLLAWKVSPLFALVPAGIGLGLTYAGVTNLCGMAMILTRLPYNRGPACDPARVVAALTGNQKSCCS